MSVGRSAAMMRVLRISEIHRLFTYLTGVINCFLLEMLHISGTAISVIVCNCMSFFVTSFVVHLPETYKIQWLRKPTCQKTARSV